MVGNILALLLFMGTIGIYKIENVVNGKVYVGQSLDIESRWKNHIYHLNKGDSPNSYLQRSWDKYGIDSFSFSIIESCAADELNSREIYWIDKFNSYECGYNLTKGGGGTAGYKLTADQVTRLRSALKGKPKSETYRKAMSERVKRWIQENGSPSSIAVVCLNTGKQYSNSNEASADTGVLSTSIRRCCKGELNSAGKSADGTRLVWMDTDKYIRLTEEEIEDIIYTANIPKTGSNGTDAKRVVLLNTGEIFWSIVEAAGKYQVGNTSITTQCRSLSSGKSDKCFAGTFPGTNIRLVWAYYDDYIAMSDEQKIAAVNFANRPESDARTKEGRQIVCLNNRQIYANTAEAGRELNLKKATNIRRCISGELRSCGKLASGEKLVWVSLSDYKMMSEDDIAAKISAANDCSWFITRSVICLNNNRIFESIKSATEEYCVNVNSLIACCQGKRKSAGKDPVTGEKLVWKYLKDYEQALPSDNDAA